MSEDPLEDLFARFIDEDESWLREHWELITGKLAEVAAEQQGLRVRGERLEARLAVLEGVAQLREVELRTWDTDVGAAGAGPVSPKDICLAILRDADVEWSAPSLHQALVDRGTATSRSNIRMILRRLVDEGLVLHVARGRYKAASHGAGRLSDRAPRA